MRRGESIPFYSLRLFTSYTALGVCYLLIIPANILKGVWVGAQAAWSILDVSAGQ